MNRTLGALFELATSALLVLLWWRGYFTNAITGVTSAVQTPPALRLLTIPGHNAPATIGVGAGATGIPALTPLPGFGVGAGATGA